MPEFDSVYLVYLFVGLAAGLFVEAIYLLFFTSRSYRKNVNRRLQLLEGANDREAMLVQLRRERGLNTSGDFRLPLIALNRLILQSGLTVGIVKLAIYASVGAMFAFGLVIVALEVLFAIFMRRGRNWARIVLAVFGTIGVLFALGGLFSSSSTVVGGHEIVTRSGLSTTLTVVQAVIIVAAIVMFFRPAANAWFKAPR